MGFANCYVFEWKHKDLPSWLIDWLIGASLSSYLEKATVRYAVDESAPA